MKKDTARCNASCFHQMPINKSFKNFEMLSWCTIFMLLLPRRLLVIMHFKHYLTFQKHIYCLLFLISFWFQICCNDILYLQIFFFAPDNVWLALRLPCITKIVDITIRLKIRMTSLKKAIYEYTLEYKRVRVACFFSEI